MTKLIAIIDDEVEMEFIYSLLLEDQLEQELVKMEFFSDARKFLEWLPAHSPDLILSDLNMPHFTGVELGQRIRDEGLDVPTYFVSGDDEADHRKELQAFEHCRYICKPFNLPRVHELIMNDLGLS